MKVKVLSTHAHVSAHVHKVLSLSFSRNSVSNYAGFGTLILEYFNYSIERRVPQMEYLLETGNERLRQCEFYMYTNFLDSWRD